jgi:hypothetical protein
LQRRKEKTTTLLAGMFSTMTLYIGPTSREQRNWKDLKTKKWIMKQEKLLWQKILKNKSLKGDNFQEGECISTRKMLTILMKEIESSTKN